MAVWRRLECTASVVALLCLSGCTAMGPLGDLQNSSWTDTSGGGTLLNVESVQLYSAGSTLKAGEELWLNISGTVVKPIECVPTPAARCPDPLVSA